MTLYTMEQFGHMIVHNNVNMCILLFVLGNWCRYSHLNLISVLFVAFSVIGVCIYSTDVQTHDPGHTFETISVSVHGRKST